MFTSLGNVPGPQLIPVHLTKPGPPGDSGGEPELVKLPASQCLKQCVCGRQHRDSAVLFDTQDTSATTHVHPRYPTASLTMQAHSTVEPVACLAGTLASARNASTRDTRCSFPSYGSTLEPPGHTSAFGMNEFAASSALASTTLAHTNAAHLTPVRPLYQDCSLRRLRRKTTPATPVTDADHDAISSLRIAAAHHA